MTDYSPFVELIDKSMPLIVNAWKKTYKEGYKARIDGKPRMAHVRRGGHRGMWFKGWDDANKDSR